MLEIVHYLKTVYTYFCLIECNESLEFRSDVEFEEF